MNFHMEELNNTHIKLWKKFKAFMEFVGSNNVKFEYIGYCRYDEQVA